MKLKIFTFRFSDDEGGFDDTALQEFMAGKEIIDFTEHFFMRDTTPYLTVLIAYRLISADEKGRGRNRESPREELDETEKTIFDALRAWRAARAQTDGIPPYMIATNRQLARFIRLKARTKTDLGAVSGIGEGKIAKYGDEMLSILAQSSDTVEAQEATDREESER